MRRGLTLALAAWIALGAAPWGEATEPAQQERAQLEEAKALYQSARFDAAIVRLEHAVTRMQRLRDLELRRLLLGDAYLHLALAHLALDDRVAARDAMRRMLLADRDRRIDADLYAPKVVTLFDEVKRELDLEVPLYVPSPEDKYTKRLRNCSRVLMRVLEDPGWIPENLMRRTACVAAVPSVKKFALGVGIRGGHGAVVCRGDDGRWAAPLMISLKGGGGGLQFGGQSTDVVLLLLLRGADYLLKGKLTLGVDATLAAGPGAKAATDGLLDAEVVTYSRTRGIFAGVSFEGAVVRPDHEANRRVYGEEVDPWELVKTSRAPLPEAAYRLVDTVRLVTASVPASVPPAPEPPPSEEPRGR